MEWNAKFTWTVQIKHITSNQLAAVSLCFMARPFPLLLGVQKVFGTV